MPSTAYITTDVEETQRLDYETGEMVVDRRHIESETRIRSDEPDFIKLYLDTVSVFMGIEKSGNQLLAYLLPTMSFASEQQICRLTSWDRKQIQEQTGMTQATISRQLRALEDKQILRKLGEGAYQVNPHIAGRGSWKDIKTLRATFDYINRTIELEKVTEHDNDLPF